MEDGMLVKSFPTTNKPKATNFNLNIRGAVSLLLKCFESLEIVVNWKETFKLTIFQGKRFR